MVAANLLLEALHNLALAFYFIACAVIISAILGLIVGSPIVLLYMVFNH